MDEQAFVQLPYTNPAEWRTGDWVAWNRSKLVLPSQLPIVVAQITRLAKSGEWADINYRIPEAERGDLAIAWNITHRRTRVKTSYCRKIIPPEER